MAGAITEAVYGPEHLRTARYLTELGDACRELGDNNTAREQLSRAAAISTVVSGPEHPDTLLARSLLDSLS